MTREEMVELVGAHASLPDPMETAIWIRREDREAWLVELIPSLAADDHPERPISFGPGLTFRHPLNLYASNLDGLRRAIENDPEIARAVADGEILHGTARGTELQTLARGTHGHAKTG